MIYTKDLKILRYDRKELIKEYEEILDCAEVIKRKIDILKVQFFLEENEAARIKEYCDYVQLATIDSLLPITIEKEC